ncbi:MAG: hypothetical protein WBC18_11600 [Ottowia sp.]|uniref:hypothetical protein n=1 Tax=unclassified Ottowia TaxID=2645081 RepID=UPI003C2FF504
MAQGGGASAASDRRTLRTTWLLFAPPFAVAALHWWLTTLSEKDPAPLQVLSAAAAPVGGPGSLLWQASLPFIQAVVALALLVLAARWSWRRFGRARMISVAAGLWLALWACAAGAVSYRYLDRTGRQALPGRGATVLQASEQPASARSVGGAKVLLRVQGFEVPQSVLLEGAEATRLPAGTPVDLSLARGRFGQVYVTGWKTG